MYKFNDRVIVENYGVKQLGAIISTSKKRNRRVYDIMLESGSTVCNVPVDMKGRQVNINSALTKSIAPKVSSNLDVLFKGNLR